MARSSCRAQRADRRHQKVSIAVGDAIYISKMNTNTQGRGKLVFPKRGPFKVVNKVNNIFHVEIPASALFDKSQKTGSSQAQDFQQPEIINGEEEWVVEKILGCRPAKDGDVEYRIKWAGFGKDRGWYPSRNLENAQGAVADFHRANPTPAPPQWLRKKHAGLLENQNE